MYYDQGPLDEPQRPFFNDIPYHSPANGMPPAIAPPRRKRRQGSYADYYNGMTGGGGGGSASMSASRYQQLSPYPRDWTGTSRGVIGGNVTGGRPIMPYDIRQAYGQRPMQLYGQQGGQMGGGYRPLMLRNSLATGGGPGMQMPQYNQPSYSGRELY
jgi:hypothetical protein